MREFLLMRDGWERVDNEKWKHTRYMVYQIACLANTENAKTSIYEFMPLLGDPTKEQIEAARKEQAEKNKKFFNDQVERYIAMGIMTRTNPKDN